MEDEDDTDWKMLRVVVGGDFGGDVVEDIDFAAVDDVGMLPPPIQTWTLTWASSGDGGGGEASSTFYTFKTFNYNN